ncbi:hypothetical protein BJV78DRAFT_1286872 [Lactifluus subvellereus]|nr:hypothetical protein BJV78DRAFT_1286872 [Lactifluus subvellereus]
MEDNNNGDREDSDSEGNSSENTKGYHNDAEDSEANYTGPVLNSPTSSWEITHCKKQLASLARDIQYIQKQPQNSPCTKGNVQIILKHMCHCTRLEHSLATGRHKRNMHQSQHNLVMKMEVHIKVGPTKTQHSAQVQGCVRPTKTPNTKGWAWCSEL